MKTTPTIPYPYLRLKFIPRYKGYALPINKWEETVEAFPSDKNG